MKITLTKTFEKTIKKLHNNQLKALEDAIDEIALTPTIGEAKKGDLAAVRVYKFRLHNQLMLVAYLYQKVVQEITLLSFSSHENFYRDLKQSERK